MTEPLPESEDESGFVEDTSTRNRILAATVEALGRSGHTKLSLSEVAVHAGVSRPTLYRWFASKEELLTAFGVYERDMFVTGLARATSGLHRNQKLDAALSFIVEYQQSYSGARLVDVEPEAAVAQLAQVIPVMRAGLQRLIIGPNAAVKAAVAIRVAVSQYIVRSDDADQFLAQLRHAVGIKQSGPNK
jgi:AcrR family transcriptional regulator